jgi:Flp pilus assembly protein protease CpaA
MGGVPVTVVVVLIAVIIAAITDLRCFRIHNALTLPLLVTGLIFHTYLSGTAGLINSFAGVAFGSGLLMIFYLLGGIGAGDVKMMAGIGAWLGWPLIVTVLLVTAIAGAVYAVGLIVAFGRGEKRGTGQTIENAVRQDDRRRRLVPFGLMMMVGVIVTTACILSGHGLIDMSGGAP